MNDSVQDQDDVADMLMCSRMTKNNKYKIPAYDDIASGKYKVKPLPDGPLKKSKYPLVKYKFDIKATNVIIGSSMSGKTTILLHLWATFLQHKHSINNVFIISQTCKFNDSLKPITDAMKAYDEKHELPWDERVYENNVFDEWNQDIMEQFDSMYSSCKDTEAGEREEILLIFDDVLGLIPELASDMRGNTLNKKFFSKLSCECRHVKWRCFYLLHQYSNNIIHKNASLYFIANSPQIKLVMRNTLRSVTDTDAEDIWNSTLKSNKYPFLVVDVTGKNDSYKKPSVYSTLEYAMLISSKRINISNIRLDNFKKNPRKYIK